MVFTAVDVGVAVLVLISAILATARGFTREILSLATWVGAAAVAAYLYFYQPDLLKPYFAEEPIGLIVLVGAAKQRDNFEQAADVSADKTADIDGR